MNLKNYGVTGDAVIPGKHQSPASVSSQIRHSPADFRSAVNSGVAVAPTNVGAKSEAAPEARNLLVAFGCAFAAAFFLSAAFFSLKAAFDLGATSSESAGFAMLAVGCFVAVIALAETSLSRFFDE